MKKRILSGLFALALLAATGYSVNKSMKSDTGLSDLVLTNVEALASGEGGDQTLSCWKTINSQGNQTTTHKTYCGSCEAVPVHSWSNEGTCNK